MDKKDDYKYNLAKGQAWEKAFMEAFARLNIPLERNDTEQVTNMDFRLNLPFDLKVRLVPFNMAYQYVGIRPEKALPINVNKLERYIAKGEGMICFYVDYRPTRETYGIYLLTVPKAAALFHSKKNRIHAYKDRKTGNNSAKESFYISIDECQRLPDFFFDAVSQQKLTHEP